MEKDTRGAIERATQKVRKLLEEDFAVQLEGDFDVHMNGRIAPQGGKHLSARQTFARERIVAAIEHKRAAGMSSTDAVGDYLRDAAFTTLNRFVALKMLEARELVQECITKGEQSGGYREFCGMAPGVPLLPENAGYRLYIESLFDELSTEVKVLFDRRDPSSVLWPKRATFEQLLEILNATELTRVWGEDETIGWVYQFFNGQDERRKMREESQAPRNSRELAVRNQFFTPRYVVQFLTDNTLGRIWYEMREAETALADRCEYMVRKPGEEFAPRAKKDPRDLRVLDPACGSGHFLLYAFDLLLAIYEEAHADPASPKSEATGKTLAEDYPSFDALKKAVPGLVLSHNLHGVDIDPRCAQIAQLALWMRAQKAYRDHGVGRDERTQIRRSNIVVAEPLVADDQIAKEFVTKLVDAELGRVFTSLVESLSLAGELGLLLRVERLITRQAKRGQTGDLFAPPEERIRAALDRFLREHASATSTRRRLFADDAAHGVALLRVAEEQFDAVLMNPPFGSGSLRSKKTLDRSYPLTKSDICAAFVERAIERLAPNGRIGAITSRALFFLTGLARFRTEQLLAEAPPVLFADLGLGVMDGAVVEAAAYVLERQAPSSDSIVTCIRVLESLATNKRDDLYNVVQAFRDTGQASVFQPKLKSLLSLPNAPLAYWASPALIDAFRALPTVEGLGARLQLGASTGDNFRFVRAWWELPADEAWTPFAKGGAYARYFADIYLLIKWGSKPREIDALVCARYPYLNGDSAWVLHPESFYGRAGITWTRRTKSALSARMLPAGCVFSEKGPGLFMDSRDGGQLALLAIVNSSPFRALIELQVAAGEPTTRGGVARSYEIGLVARTPVPRLSSAESSALADVVQQCWSVQYRLDSTGETSRAFRLPVELASSIHDLNEGHLREHLARLEEFLERKVLALYGLKSTDCEISRELESAEPLSAAPETDEDGEDVAGGGLSDTSGGDQLLSWLVGVVFGRFDVRLATRERPLPPEPKSTDPLASRSPGMYPEGDEPVGRHDMLVDDEGHSDDLAARAIAVAERVKLDAPENLRAWLAREFFPLHIRMYSKSRRKAPIYWQLATPSAGYSVWLYLHAFSKDTLFRVRNDYVAPKLAHEERRLESLTSELRDGATAAQRKQLASQEAFVEELRAFLDEVKRVAPLWNPHLDDGVIINFAPLWRLVPQHKAWQKELKSTWDALVDGKYDWAHLSMHLWPERVVPKCAKDRSLAIAHGLEEEFWIEGTDGKWAARKTPTCSVEDLVRERTSPTVKSALKSLLEAPVASGKSTGRKGGGRRKAAAAERGDA